MWKVWGAGGLIQNPKHAAGRARRPAYRHDTATVDRVAFQLPGRAPMHGVQPPHRVGRRPTHSDPKATFRGAGYPRLAACHVLRLGLASALVAGKLNTVGTVDHAHPRRATHQLWRRRHRCRRTAPCAWSPSARWQPRCMRGGLPARKAASPSCWQRLLCGKLQEAETCLPLSAAAERDLP